MTPALVWRQPVAVAAAERSAARHRLHALALMAPYIAFPLLYALSWNPIYPGIVALAIGAASTVACRPELARKSLLGGVLFAGLYAVFVALLILSAPGYVGQVWNLADLSGVLVAGIPLEELAFGFAFGMYWSSLYEHFSGRAIGARAASTLVPQRGHHG